MLFKNLYQNHVFFVQILFLQKCKFYLLCNLLGNVQLCGVEATRVCLCIV